MAASVSTSPTFGVINLQPLFPYPSELSSTAWPQYEVSADDSRFLVTPVTRAAARVIVVENFFEELRQKVGND